MPKLKQPILIIQGDLDTQVEPHHADKLGELARARKKDAGPVEVVHLPGVNHLLVPATTGEVTGVRRAEAEDDQPRGRLDHRLLAEEVAAVSVIVLDSLPT